MKNKLLCAVAFALIFGCSLNDNEQGATPCSFCGISPKAEYSVTASASSTSSVTISWQPVSYAAGYNIYRSTSANGYYTQIGSASSTSYTDQNASSGTAYYYRVAAYNSNGTGSQSSYASAITALDDVSASASSTSSVTVRWQSVSNATGYNIYRSTNPNGNYTQIGSASSASYTDNSVSAGTIYYYKVNAYNSNAESPQSNYATATTPPNTPANVSASASSTSSVTVSWQYVSNATGYSIYRSTNPSGTYTQIGSSTTNSYTDNSLQPGTTYYYKVAAYKADAYNRNVESNQSGYANATTQLSTPANVSASASSTSRITVSWQSVSNATGYNIYRSTNPNGNYDKVGSASSTATSYPDNSVSAGTTYYYKVAAYNSNVESNQSDYASVTTQLNTPSGVNASASSTSRITVSWQSVSNATGYNIYRSESPSGNYEKKVGSSTTTSYTDSGLSSGTIYYYKVVAYNSNAESNQSNYATAITALDDVTASASSANSVTVSWPSVTNATGYYVYHSTSANGTYTRIDNYTATSYTNSGLSPGTTYYYKVTAYKTDAYNNNVESPQSSISATTQPDTPTGVTVSSNSNSITVSWSYVPNATGYYVYHSTSANGTYTRIDNYTATSYTNSGLSSGTTYYYKVTAYKTDAYNNNVESSPSSISATTQ